MVKVAINGFGRIGRLATRILVGHPELELVAINSNGAVESSAHLFKYDSTYGVYQGKVETKENLLIVDGHEIRYSREREPQNLPWSDLSVDIVIDCTGKFTEKDQAALYKEVGAKKVLLSSPGKNEDVTLVMGVNENTYNADEHFLISNASCTTNCLAPVVKVLNESFGIEKGLMTTVHAYTNDQLVLDKSHRDLRRARAAALSIIPTTTGAAKSVSLVLPELEGKLNGLALRVPTPTVSVVDLVIETQKPVTKESVNEAFEKAAAGELKGILDVTYDPVVSVDFTGNDYSAVIDAQLTMVMGENQVKVLAWYDNEWGYTRRLIEMAVYIAEKGLS
jgi:glyceraldehyde 3-phosphate dehydrogenase